MADVIVPTITLAPRVPKDPKIITATATDELTVFVTKEVTVFVTTTVETTTSIFETSFIHVIHTVTNSSTIREPTTVTEVQTLAPKIASATTSLPTHACPALPAHASGKKHVDPFQILSIVFGVFILMLIALMCFLVRRFYKMYRAERVMRKKMNTEGMELPPMKMSVNEGETHIVGEE